MTGIEIVGNALSLDFTNTVNVRPVPQRDWLRTADDVVSWAESAGHPLNGGREHLDTTLPGARDLREVVYRVFRPLAHGDSPPRADLQALTAEYGQAAARAILHRADDDDAFVLSWPGARTLRVLLWEVAVSAVDLLTEGRLERLGECPACGWLFLDTSKNGRRRWCSMATCGSRYKARRYYVAHQATVDTQGTRQ